MQRRFFGWIQQLTLLSFTKIAGIRSGRLFAPIGIKPAFAFLLVPLLAVGLALLVAPQVNASITAAKGYTKSDCEARDGVWRSAPRTVPSCSVSIASSWTPEEETRSLGLFTTFSYCLHAYGSRDQFDTNTTGDDLSKLFSVTSTGSENCQSQKLFSSISSLWGVSTKDMLSELGYTFQTNTNTGYPTYNSNLSKEERVERFKSEITRVFYGTTNSSGVSPTRDNASGQAKYNIATALFNSPYTQGTTYEAGSCRAKSLGIYPNALNQADRDYVQNGTEKREGDFWTAGEGDGWWLYTILDIVTGTGEDVATTQYGYKYLKHVNWPSDWDGADTSVNLTTALGFGYASGLSWSCTELAKAINDNAGAMKAWLLNNPDKANIGGLTVCPDGSLISPGQNCEDDDLLSPTTCAVDQVGWMLCPILNGIGSMNDLMYWVIESILVLNPITTHEGGNSSNPETPLYVAWQSIRNIANVLLVVIFILVIFSQITNIGVSNYGIKKILPRIIIVAIAINLSFFAIMIAVDIVNIIGSALYDLLISLAPDVSSATLNGANVGTSFAATISTVVLAVGGVALGAAIISATAMAWLALPFIVVAALALLAALLTLFIRNALVIVLALLAPIAFAAFLLPNTQPLFDRWRKTLISMLFLYPTAALLFGGSKFAAYIMATSDQPLAAFVAIITMAVPLGMLPWLAASSGGILAKVGGKLQGLAQSAKRPLQGLTDPLAKRATKNYQAGRTTSFGKRRSLDEMRSRRKEGKRNLGQRFGEAAKRRELDTANADKQITENLKDSERRRSITERARNVAGKGRNAAPNVFDDQRTLASQESASNAMYDRRSDQRRATAGTVDHTFAIQEKTQNLSSEKYKSQLDAQFKQLVADSPSMVQTVQATKKLDETSKTLDTEQDQIFSIAKNQDQELKDLADRQHDAQMDITEAEGKGEDRQAKRVKNNRLSTTSGVQLRKQAGRIARLEGETKATELETDQMIKDSGVLDAGTQRQKDAELKIKAHDDEQQEVFDERVLKDRDQDGDPGELLQAADRIASAKGGSDRWQSGLKLRGQRQANVDGSKESDDRIAKEDSDFKADVIGSENAADLEERKATNLATEENKRRASEQVKKTATDEQLSNYSEAVSEEGSDIQTRAGGTVNPEEGKIKATAYGLEAQRQLDEANVKAAAVLGGNTSEQAYQGDIRVDENNELELDSEDPALIADLLLRTGVISAGDIPTQPDGTIARGDVHQWARNNPALAASVGLQAPPLGIARMLTSNKDILTAAGRRARIIGDNDTIDNANPGLIPSLKRVQNFTADTQRGGTSTTFGVQATATNLAQGKRLTAQGLMEMFDGLPPLPDRTTDPAGWQRELEERSQMVTNINKAAEASGLPHMSKNRLRPDGTLEIGGEKGGVVGMVTDLFQTNTPITKHALQDTSAVRNPDGTQVVVGDEIARQFFDLMTDPSRRDQYLRSARSMNYETLEVLAGRLSQVGGGNRDAILAQLRTDSGQAQREFST